MKTLLKALIPAAFAGLFATSCFDPPVYSETPVIEFQKVEFVDVPEASESDTLILSVTFKDGDGDLGIDPSETAPPFNNKWYFLDGQDNIITYKTKRTDPNYDTLPAFVKPYNCVNWEVDTLKGVLDTIYFELNPNHYNIYVDFLVKNSDGSFTQFDWTKEFTYPNCGITFDGRFPILSKDLSRKSPLDGTIRYGMSSTGFLILFSIKTLKLRITIQDRHFNKSNTIETPEFTLQSIKRSG